MTVLKSNLFNTTSRYDFILFNEDNILETLNVFEAALKEGRTNFYLHADATYEHNETLIKQIIDPNNLNANIFLYSKEELLDIKISDCIEKATGKIRNYRNHITQKRSEYFVTCD